MKTDHDILTKEDLIELTGEHYKSNQCKFLDNAGIWYQARRDGSPSTTWYHVANPIALRGAAPPPAYPTEPNFDAM